MIWKPIPQHETMYEISETGDVRRIAPGKRTVVGRLLRPKLRPTARYLEVKLYDGAGGYEQQHVHVLVARAFLGPRPPGFEINHKDTDRLHNHFSNLEYTTRLENARHAAANGLYKRGEQVTGSKLTALEVRAMRALWTCGFTQRALAKAFGLSQATVGAILHRRWWKHV